MKTSVKIILSILLFLIGFFFMGVEMPYFFGRVFLRMGLFTAAIIGIVAIWKKRQNNENENEKSDNTLNKD